MKKAHAIALASSQADLARLLDITDSAVTQWGDDVPDARVWQLMVLRPAWFAEGKPSIVAKPAPAGA